MKIGIAVADITPPLGTCLQGHFNRREASGIHDPLQAKAFTFACNDGCIAIVGCDLVGVPRDLTDKARAQISEQCQIPASRVMIWGTHTHAGPVVLSDGLDECDAQYLAQLGDTLAGLVAQALNEAQERSLTVAFGEERGIAFNRRYLMRDGSIRTNPGVGNPDILRPLAPIDPQVGCLFVSEGDALTGAFVNFGCHLDVLGSGNTLISADYAYYLEQTVRAGCCGSDNASAAPAPVVLFGNGPCGDINHINVHARDRQGGFEHSRKMGQILGGEVLKCLGTAQPLAADAVSGRSATVSLPYRKFTDAELCAFRETLSQPEPPGRSFARINARECLRRHESGIAAYMAEVQVLQIGDIAVVGIPGEYFVEFGIALKQRSPAAHTFIVELANDCIGYIPTPEALAAGAYEGNSACFVPEAGQMLADAAIELIEEGAAR